MADGFHIRMNGMSENPYESPKEIDPALVPDHNSDSTWIGIRKSAAIAGIAFAAMIGLLGQIITFVPGAEANWFGFGAGLSLLGFLWPGWRVRALAAVLFIWLACLSWNGHQRGIYYREWLRQRGESSRAVNSLGIQAPPLR